MTPQELKNSILQLAIQGKLVEQRPEEGTAQELYHQIQAEKRRLIKEGKIKKEKPLPEIAEDEKPFEIPESWMWVRLGEIFQHNTGKALNLTNRAGVSLKYITTSNLYWNRFELSNLKEMFFTDSEIEKCTVKKGDLLVCEGGDIGRAAIWQNDETICIQNHIHRLRAFRTVCTEFFYYLFYLYKHAGWIGGKGIGIQGLSSKAIHVLVFPLPPLAEQKRIVAKIEELLPYIDRYEQAWSKLEQFNTRFPEDMKKSLLQYAIQGKLVEQRPEEGTAEELFAQIQEEKQRLIAAKKIKKEKPLPEVTEDEKPFDIPESWKWVRLRDVAYITGGYAFKSTAFCDNGVRVIRISDFNEDGFVNNKIVRHPFDESLAPFMLEKKNILLCMTGGTVGKSYFVRNIDEPMMTNQRVATIKIIVAAEEYINFVILSSVIQKIIRTSKNSTNDNISMDTINSFPVPLPPLAEQKRIVEKLEQLLPLCERLGFQYRKLQNGGK